MEDNKETDMSEEVLVFDESYMEGFSDRFWKDRYSHLHIDTSHFWMDCMPHAYFVSREEAENNPSIKQIIPYTVLYRDGFMGRQFLTYKRTKSGGEDRLHEKYSIGIGGHINRQDIAGGILSIENSIKREMSEEITIIEGEMSSFIQSSRAVLYDPSDDVGKVHFGVITNICAQYLGVVPNEDCIKDIKWIDGYKLRDIDSLENWSKIIIRNM